MTSLNVDTFKRRFGISQAKLNFWKRQGIVKVIQSGYKGHSLAHPRQVEFDSKKLAAFMSIATSKPNDSLPYICEGSKWRPERICNLSFGTKRDLVKHQRETSHNIFTRTPDKVLLKAWKVKSKV